MSKNKPFEPFYDHNRGWRLKLHLWCRAAAKGRHQHLLFILASFANECGECYPGIKKIADNMGFHPRTVQKMLRELEATGIISTKRDYKNGQQSTNIYTLDYHHHPLVAYRPPLGVVPTPPKGDHISLSSRSKSEERKKENSSLGGTTAAEGDQNQASPSGGPSSESEPGGRIVWLADDPEWVAAARGSVRANGKM